MLVKLHEIGKRLLLLDLLRRIEHYKVAADVGLHQGQLPVMEYIIRNEGCTQREIADMLKVTPASIAISTKRLQKAGLIQKKTDDSNLRRNKLYATQMGVEMSRKCRNRFDEIDKKLFAGFDDHELMAMKDYLDRMIRNLSDDRETNIDIFAFASLRHEMKKNSSKKR